MRVIGARVSHTVLFGFSFLFCFSPLFKFLPSEVFFYLSYICMYFIESH